MKVEFRLHRLPAQERADADALLVPSLDAGVLLALLAALGADPLPPVHAVADGFLVVLGQPIATAPPGVVALRKLTAGLYIPADALLVPPLLPDEAAGLVRDRGLVFLPGGPILVFDPASPVSLSILLRAGEVSRPAWQSFPERPPLSDRLREIWRDQPEDTAAALIERGDEGVGSEEAGTPDAGPMQTLGNRVKLLTGQALMKLGRALGMQGLLGLGAGMVEAALSQVPRLAEGWLGRQEAALRDLLRQFREGDAERALRRAIPVVEPGSRGATPAAGDQLPPRTLDYSLGNLLGSNRGPAGLWLGGLDVQQELIWEYRKAAQLAEQRGDYRRAAMIYARLLGDYRSAAGVLQRGGLFHDAALIYLEKVGDVLSAARAFAAAGEVDRAVKLFRQEGAHAEAADLLRQAGEEEESLAEYRLAAEALARTPRGWLAAGELMLQRASRPDLADEYFARGWANRPDANALACALHLARLRAEEGSPDGLLTLMSEASDFLREWGGDASAAEFYNTVVKLADQPNLAAAREEVRDRALVGLAGRLRQSVERQGGPAAVSVLLGVSGAWPAAVVSDARFAAQEEAKRLRSTERRGGAMTWVRAAEDTVTAACHSERTGEVFLGLVSGGLVCFRPIDGRVTVLPLRPEGAAITSMTADPDGRFLVTVRGSDSGAWQQVCHEKRAEGQYELVPFVHDLGFGERCWLTPVVTNCGTAFHGVWNGRSLELHGSLRFWERLQLPFKADELTAVVLLPDGGKHRQAGSPMVDTSATVFEAPASVSMLLITDAVVWAQASSWKGRHQSRLGWAPVPASISWRQCDPQHVELAGLRSDGAVCWSLLLFGDGMLHNLATHITGELGYRAATLVRPGLLAAVGPSRIDWLRAGNRGFSLWTSQWVSAPQTVACFPSHRTNEVILVCADGQLGRVPVPG